MKQKNNNTYVNYYIWTDRQDFLPNKWSLDIKLTETSLSFGIWQNQHIYLEMLLLSSECFSVLHEEDFILKVWNQKQHYTHTYHSKTVSCSMLSKCNLIWLIWTYDVRLVHKNLNKKKKVLLRHRCIRLLWLVWIMIFCEEHRHK